MQCSQVPENYYPNSVWEEYRDYFIEKEGKTKGKKRRPTSDGKEQKVVWVSKQELNMDHKHNRCLHLLYILEEELIAEYKRELSLKGMVSFMGS